MALDSTLASIPADGFSLKLGTAWYDGSRWWAVVGGNPLGARWADPTQAVQGMNVLVGIINEGRGQSSAVVLSGVTEQPRPSSGQITAVGVDELLFAGDDGGVYATKRYLGAVSDYAVLDPVQLIWTMGNPTVLGIIGEVAVPPPAPPPPPPPVISTGTEVLTATASDTFGVGGWGRWAGGGEKVYSGSYGGYTLTGSFFYGAPRPALQGKTVTAIRFRVPQRLAVGNYNSAATIHLYAHTSQARPGGDVARVAGPFDISVTAGQGPSWVNISSAHPDFVGIANTLAAGGGISFAGDPYTGWTSRLTDPLAGQIELDWSA
ncbi:hypothetical protein [Paenarthrobacter sp.]|uniref:hypothetical protein n=1 Tax=Paenarthrobacter sp. TaxID=1931993 RepID=UPI0028122A97|nr:hypothetical protein [Paenarthrobacter sp.]